MNEFRDNTVSLVEHPLFKDKVGDLWRANYGEVWRVIGINGIDLVLESVDAERAGGCKVTLVSKTTARKTGRRMTEREAAIHADPLGFDVAVFFLPWLLGGDNGK